MNSEPTGPNSPLVTNSNGYQLYYGPGFNLDINRPPACTVSSTATSGTTTSLTDTAQSWMSNEYVGSKMTITGGTGSGESATITGNNSNTLSFAALATAPDSTSSYTITGNGLVTGANCVAGEVLGDGGTTSSATRKDSTGVTSSGSSVTDNSIAADDTGREVVAATVGGASITAPGTTAYDDAFQVGGVDLSSTDAVYVGEVTQYQVLPTTAAGTGVSTDAGSFQLIDSSGNAVTPTGTVTSVTLSAECDPAVTSVPAGGTNLPSTCTGTETPDPIFDALDPTPGGGDTGSVLISPYITPGSVSTVAYNHYDWLRTVEDIFDVNSCTQANAGASSDDITLTAGTVCGGLDGDGHIGYAAQTDLNDFGLDVFTAPTGDGFQELPGPPIDLPEAPLTVGLALAGIVILGGYLVFRRRRSAVAVAE